MANKMTLTFIHSIPIQPQKSGIPSPANEMTITNAISVFRQLAKYRKFKTLLGFYSY